MYADHGCSGLQTCCGVCHIANERQVGIDAVVPSQAFGRSDPALVSRNLRNTSLPETGRERPLTHRHNDAVGFDVVFLHK